MIIVALIFPISFSANLTTWMFFFISLIFSFIVNTQINLLTGIMTFFFFNNTGLNSCETSRYRFVLRSFAAHFFLSSLGARHHDLSTVSSDQLCSKYDFYRGLCRSGNLSGFVVTSHLGDCFTDSD